MDATIAIIKQTINAAAGPVSWGALVDAVGPANRRYILAAMTAIEQEGFAARRTRYDPVAGGVFEVVKL